MQQKQKKRRCGDGESDRLAPTEPPDAVRETRTGTPREPLPRGAGMPSTGPALPCCTSAGNSLRVGVTRKRSPVCVSRTATGCSKLHRRRRGGAASFLPMAVGGGSTSWHRCCGELGPQPVCSGNLPRWAAVSASARVLWLAPLNKTLKPTSRSCIAAPVPPASAIAALSLSCALRS